MKQSGEIYNKRQNLSNARTMVHGKSFEQLLDAIVELPGHPIFPLSSKKLKK